MREEWGPWIEHDGSGCPCVGMYAQWVWDNGVIREGIAGISRVNPITGEVLGARKGCGPNVWDWATKPIRRAIRYRIRKPRGMTILESLLENLPDEVKA